MLSTYQWTFDRVIAFKSIMLMVTIGTFFATIVLYVIVPKGFFPTEDTGYVIGITEGATDISFPAIAQLQRKVADIVRADPAVAYVNSTVGTGGPNSVGNSGRMLVALKPRKERDDLQTILARLRQTANVGARSRDLFPADPEYQSRRQACQKPISVHAAIQRHGGALPA